MHQQATAVEIRTSARSNPAGPHGSLCAARTHSAAAHHEGAVRVPSRAPTPRHLPQRIFVRRAQTAAINTTILVCGGGGTVAATDLNLHLIRFTPWRSRLARWPRSSGGKYPKGACGDAASDPPEAECRGSGECLREDNHTSV
jgi:hypothetical protein